MSTFLQYLFNGVTIGAVYALVGVGLTLGIGVARFFNFAQGQLAVLAAFVAIALTQAGVPFYVALALALLVTAGVGVGIRGVIVPFAGRDSLVIFLGTLGIGYVIADASVLIWGAEQRSIDSPWPGQTEIAGVVIDHSKLLLIAVSAPIIVALYVVLSRTDLGRRMRACAENTEVSSLLGINVPRTMRTAIGIGSALAALAGVLVATLFPVSAFDGSAFLTKGIAVALIGGLGSVTGAVVCGLSLGVIETLATAYSIAIGPIYLGSNWQNGYAFVLMIVVLAWRPQGLFRGTGEL
jgi:branched-chain amino acid transport system permease protein